MQDSKSIILTGASRGIGLAIAHYLLQRNHKLLLVSRTEAPLRQLESQYGSENVAVLATDLNDLSAGGKVADLAAKFFGGSIDGLIVNHGVLDPVKRVKDSTAAAWREAFDVNLFSAVGLVQACLPGLREGKGRIVLTSSGASTNAYPTWGAYGASKAALNHFAMTLGNEEKDIVTVSVRPGVVDTEMQRDIREKHSKEMDETDAARFAELKKSGGLLKPEQPGNVMARLALDAPRELSGKFLTWNAPELKAFQD